MVIENVRNHHVDSSDKDTSRRWLPLRRDNMSRVALDCLTEALAKTHTATQGAFATEMPTARVDGWISGTAEAFATAVAAMHQRGEGVEGSVSNQHAMLQLLKASAPTKSSSLSSATKSSGWGKQT